MRVDASLPVSVGTQRYVCYNVRGAGARTGALARSSICKLNGRKVGLMDAVTRCGAGGERCSFAHRAYTADAVAEGKPRLSSAGGRGTINRWHGALLMRMRRTSRLDDLLPSSWCRSRRDTNRVPCLMTV